MKCRPHCGACCIAPQISTPIPNMPEGKPAGVPCANLDDEFNCTIWNTASFPPLCHKFQANIEHCGETQQQALTILSRWEQQTAPDI
ncbi:YkgJ family cysteine cluster protein [Amphritea opalescens]|uniref:YkgJ family cysteine cluster protein n=1 Tax=Amphritea opalescens TaxID=2490544 RepID=A0A430KM73_9GAMM|nr:YkgJ family cysteine cluster protein [Amphritea opalescens]RTE64577.1 YkgJ family cysteine cluster protein [Amphritea opalescens]